MPQNQAETRIDTIFISPNFPFTPLYSHTKKSFLYLSDYLIVAAYFQQIEPKVEQHDKRHKSRRRIFNLTQMEPSDWDAFANASDKYFRCYNYIQYERLLANRQNLNIM